MVFILKKHIFRSLATTFQKTVFLPFLYWTFSSLGVILSVWQTGDIHLNSKLNFKDSQEVFDFIVVGAGSAGSVVANRLSSHYDVLLLEAGGEPNPLQMIPGFSIFLQNWPELDYRWRSVPQKFASLNSVNQQASLSAGRGLGGTGNLNAGIYLKGSPKDWDNYAEITGDPSWGYEGVTHYFNEMETYSDPKGHKRYHGFHGHMSVELPEYQGLAGHWLLAGQEFGYPEIDPNAPHTEGFFKVYQTSKNGIRHSSYRAFLQPIRLRHSLTIRKYAHVNKLLFDEHNPGKVIGVEYDRNGIKRRAIAKKEVIISAGAIKTPQLLMLSGIGPGKLLEKLNIPIKHDLPVGKHLQDHLSVNLGPFFIHKPATIYLDRDITVSGLVNWFATGGDVMGSFGVHSGAVFTSSYAKARGEIGWPDIQLLLHGYSVWKTFPEILSRAYGLKLDEMQRYYAHAIGKESFHIVVSAARPYARGLIELSSSSPYDSPVVDPNYLSDKEHVDVKVLLEGIKASLQLAENTTTFQEFGARFTEMKLPGCEHLPFRSDEYWVCYARRYSVTLRHPCGTASMGRPGSPHAVVDSELKVIGVSNLRVMDASILPVITTTNLQAPVMVVANKGADMVIRHWKEIDRKRAQEREYLSRQLAEERDRIKQQQHSQLMDYIFEPLNNKAPQIHGPGHSISWEFKLPQLHLPKIPKIPLLAVSNVKTPLIPHESSLSITNYLPSGPQLPLLPSEQNPQMSTIHDFHDSSVNYPVHKNKNHSLPRPRPKKPMPVPIQGFNHPFAPGPKHHPSSPHPTSPIKLRLKTKKKTFGTAPTKIECIEDDFECWSSKFPPSFPKVKF